MQCLEVITQALKDPFLHDSKILSLLQRARKICLSQQTTAGSKQKKKMVSGKKRKPSSSRCTGVEDVILPYGIEHFPDMDIVEAPEVRAKDVSYIHTKRK